MNFLRYPADYLQGRLGWQSACGATAIGLNSQHSC